VETKPQPESWQLAASRLLAQAAELAVENGVDADAFIKGAWSAYVDSRPGMREWLEELQLREQIEEMRKAGVVGSA